MQKKNPGSGWEKRAQTPRDYVAVTMDRYEKITGGTGEVHRD